MGFNPIFNRVLIKRDELGEKIGSIIIPQALQDKHKPAKGTILKVGSTADECVKALVGKKILFAQYAGSEIKLGEEKLFVCNDEDVWGEETDE